MKTTTARILVAGAVDSIGFAIATEGDMNVLKDIPVYDAPVFITGKGALSYAQPLQLIYEHSPQGKSAAESE
jgi:hypothetical protein